MACIVRNKIWEELKQAHVNILCLVWYTNMRRKYNRYYDFFIAIVAAAGAFGYIKSAIAPFISSALIAFVSVVKSIFPQFMQPEKELCQLEGLIDYYNRYLIEIEYLLYKSDENVFSEQTTMDKLYSLKSEECDKMSIFNRLVRSIPKKKKEQFITESEDYLKKVYFNIYKENGNE